MDIQTAFSPGEKGWVFYDGFARTLTIGMVRVCITQSPGVDDEFDMIGSVRSYTGGMSGQPDNYAPQESRTEEYMCVETGIGSGSVWTLGKSIFKTKDECETAAAWEIEEKRRRDESIAADRAERSRREYESAKLVVQRYESKAIAA